MELSPSQSIMHQSPQIDYPFHMCTRNYPSQIRHNPHPFNVRNVKGFLGLPTRMVETEDVDSIATWQTAEQYVKDCLKRGDWNYKDRNNGYVKRTKDLDTILALQYFTGLQSYSFKEDYLPYLGYRRYYNDWRRQLRNITEVAYQPFLDLTKRKVENTIQSQHPNEWINGASNLARSKSMYSETGRLTTRGTQTNTSSSRRQNSQTPMPVTEISGPNLNELDAVVFMLLADLLQTQSVHLIQSWLSRSTEREKALITSMLQSALSKPVADIQTEMPNRSVTTSDYRAKTCPNASRAAYNNTLGKTEESNILVVETKDTEKTKIEDIRPPTSSTFNNSRVPSDNNHENKLRMKGRETARDSKVSMWSQEKSMQKWF